jgi:hypothetical protein
MTINKAFAASGRNGLARSGVMTYLKGHER